MQLLRDKKSQELVGVDLRLDRIPLLHYNNMTITRKNHFR